MEAISELAAEFRTLADKLHIAAGQAFQRDNAEASNALMDACEAAHATARNLEALA